MANTKSAIKAARQSERRRARNRRVISAMRTYVKNTRQAIRSGDVEEAQAALGRAIVALDKAAQKGVIHSNSAARRKSRLARQFNQMVAEG